MTRAQDLLRLADRCEAATGPDRELDELICAAVEGATREAQADGHVAYWRGSRWVNVTVCSVTASLDAAMTLVPEGWSVQLVQTSEYDQAQFTGKGRLDEWTAALSPGGAVDPFGRFVHGFSSTPALALVAACCRALAQGEG